MVVLSGMLEEGEMLVLGGSWLYYNNIDFLDAEGKGSIKPSIGKGRLCLTNQRLLILSAESVLGTSQKHSIDFVACTDGERVIALSKNFSLLPHLSVHV